MAKESKSFRTYAKEEIKLQQHILDLNTQVKASEKRLEEIRTKKRNAGLQYFSKEKRKEIFERAKNCGFSHKDLQAMEIYLEDEHWNQDEVVILGGILQLFQNAEEFIEENEPQTSWIRSMITSLGTFVDEEENNDN
ncbi:MAG: hypothetical protein J6K72_05990 [Clostridia bacterium]|nr:hypothetical protein [Clostridia bacterium]